MPGEVKGRKLNHTGKTIVASANRSQYDAEAISIFKHKQYLAWILKECTTEFRGMSIEDIIPRIGNPDIGTVPVEPGLTNTVVVGDLTESKIIGEGVTTYDVRFRAVAPGKGLIEIRLLLDVELWVVR